ncbi:MAG: PilZ domain-containing protein, partial [Candidatus Omnitrophota bacterium]
MITDERRAFKRVKLKFTIKYKLHGSAVSGTSVSENISLGGIYFISLEKFRIGQLIDCSISMPGIPEQGKWTARVVRCENVDNKMVTTFGIAAEFMKSLGDSEKNLKKILNESNR